MVAGDARGACLDFGRLGGSGERIPVPHHEPSRAQTAYLEQPSLICPWISLTEKKTEKHQEHMLKARCVIPDRA